MPDEDLDERLIIERIMRELLKGGAEGRGPQRPTDSSPPGIYDYDRGSSSWRRAGDVESWRPSADGIHVIFTDVAGKCLLCTALGRWWYEFAEVSYERIWPHIELCEDKVCDERAYTVAVLCVKEGEVRYARRFGGVVSVSELAGIVAEVLRRCPSASRSDEQKLKEVCPCL